MNPNPALTINLNQPPAAGSGSLAVGQNIANQFQILSLIAQGGMGEVYKVLDKQSHQEWALKRSRNLPQSPEDRALAEESFKREGEILISSQHPGLPRFKKFFVENGEQFLVMEFIPGKTLYAELVAAGQPLDYRLVHLWAIELTQVLHHLHTAMSQKIIYRDLKPHNVMVTPQGNVKLIDFGISRFFNPIKSNDTTSFVTAGYASLEQLFNKQTDERSDIFSLGVTLHHLLTNQDPQQNQNWPLGGTELTSVRWFNPDIPAELDEAITQMTRIDRELRPTNMAAVDILLRRIPIISKPVFHSTFPASQPYVAPQPLQTIVLTPNDNNPARVMPFQPSSIRITPHVLNFGTLSSRSTPKTLTLSIVGTGPHNKPLTGNVQVLDGEWLELDRTSFGQNQYQILITAQPNRLHTGHSPASSLRPDKIAGKINRVFPAWLLLIPVILGGFACAVTGFAGQFMAGLGISLLVMLWLWFYTGLLQLFVPGSRQEETFLKIHSNAGPAQATALVEVYPSTLRVSITTLIATVIALIPVFLALFMIFMRGR